MKTNQFFRTNVITSRRSLRSRLTLQALETRTVPATFQVTSQADSGSGSLREAVHLANTTPGADVIQFQIPNAQSIELQSSLETITDPVTIDGTTQKNYAGSPLVELDGKQVVDNGLRVTVAGCTFLALNVHGFTNDGIRLEAQGNHTVANCYVGTDRFGSTAQANGQNGIYLSGPNSVVRDCLISGNKNEGVKVEGVGATGNVVRGCLIGVNAAGTVALGNGHNGVFITTAPGNRVGGTTIAERNVISGNGSDTLFSGVGIAGEASDGNLITGNYLGTDFSGTKALGNHESGVYIELGADTNTISGNVVSGNLDRGITVFGTGTNNNIIIGNIVGLNAAGNSKLGNVNAGIRLDSVTSTRIGTNSDGVNDAAEGNVISGNAGGVNLVSSPSSLIAGNIIGLDATGAQSLGNNGYGVRIDANSDGSTVGGTVSVARNLISGNADVGMTLPGADGAVVVGNYIGTDFTGNLARPNLNGGITIDAYNTANAYGNRIGGTTTGSGNVISGNGAFGIRISETRDTFGYSSQAGANVVIGNRIGTNAAGTATLANTGSGVLIQAGADNNRVGTDGDGVNDAAESNLISGNSGAAVLINNIATDANVVAGNLIGTDISGAKLLPNGSGVTVQGGARGNRIGTNGNGVSDLLEANVIAGNNGDGVAGIGLDSTSFTKQKWAASTGGNDHYYVLTPVTTWKNGEAAALAAGGHLVSIAGTATVTAATENSFVFNNVRSGTDVWIGLTDDPTFGGTEFGNTSGSAVDASGTRGKGFLWTDGSNAPWPSPPGYQNWDTTEPSNTSQNENGVEMRSTGKWNDLVQGNLLPAVLEFNSDPDLNLLVPFFTTANNTVAGNRIGLDSTGAPLGNAGRGIFIDRAQGTAIGGLVANSGNVVANNAKGGILVINALSVGNSFRGNLISGNTGLGIDLSLVAGANGLGDGVTANDLGDGDAGPNGFLNFPVLSSVTRGNTTRVIGTFNSAPNADYALDVFASATADPSGYGQGQRYLGNVSVHTDASGNASFDEILPVVTAASELVTVTATSKTGNNTSEFSKALAPPVKVLGVTVNDGTVQRSRVTSLTVNFGQSVSLPANPAAAFQLKRQGDNAIVTLAAAASGSSVTLTFSGAAVDFGSLADGKYTLTVIAAQVNGGAFDGNGDGAAGDDYVLVGNTTNTLFRLFGDSNADGTVNLTDFIAFRSVYGIASTVFSFDGTGGVDLNDFVAFRGRFGMII